MSIKKRKKGVGSPFEGMGIGLGRCVILLYLLVIIYPVLFVLNTSFKPSQEFYRNVWGFPIDFTLSNYPEAWVDGRIGSAFLNSFYIVLITVTCIVAFGAMAGYALARLKIPGANLIVLLLVGLTMLPSESVLMPIYITMSRAGMIGTRESLIIPYVGWGLPITIYIFRDFFLTVPIELMEAARIDGCNEAKTFACVVAPLMLPAIATCAIFNFVNFWGELLWATVALSSQSAIRTISMGVVEFQGQFATRWGPMTAAICIVLVPLMAFFLFAQKYFVRGLTAGSVKG